MRHVPELAFLADRSGRFQARIEETHGSIAQAATNSRRTSGRGGVADA